MERYEFDLTGNGHFQGNKINEEMGDYQICFMGRIMDFDEVTIGKGQGLYSGTEVVIGTEQICIYNALDHSLAAKYPFSLEIRDYLSIVIIADLHGKARVEIASGGGQFRLDAIPWNGRMGSVFVETGSSTVLSDCVLTYFANGWKKPIWLFGDSYLNLSSPARWTSYLTAKDPSNVMLNGFPGRNSKTALAALKTALEQGTPQELIWCLGMNDGDPEDRVNENWKAVSDELQEICREKKIELVLSTIPSCKVNNRFKNEIVRKSGFRFIDFEKAVGAHLHPMWYEGMIEEGPDKVHPGEKGAIALYHRAVTECPELLSEIRMIE